MGILALAIAGFFWRTIFEENVWIPDGGGDLASFLYPTYVFAAHSLKEGIVPLWNPYLYTGSPFAADIQSGLFYPVNLAVFFLLPEITYQTMEFLAIFHFFLAGVGMYFCLRYLRAGDRQIGRPGALVGAVAFMFSDIFLVHLGNMNMNAVASWLPWVFLFFHRGLVERKSAKVAAAGMLLGTSLLAGHIQPFLYMVLGLAAYFLFEVFVGWRQGNGVRSFLRQVQLLSVFAVVAFGVAAIQLIPSWELSKASVRSSIDYATSTLWSLPPVQLVSLFVPGFFGRGPADYWGPWLRTAMGYVGVLTLVAGLIAVAFHRRRIMFFFLILAVLSLALSLGGRSVPQGWLYTLGWGFDKVRAPSRFLYLFDFALAGLAGLGIDRLLSPLKSSERRAMRGITRFLTFVLVVLAVGSLLPFLYWLTVSTELSPQTIARFSGISEGLVLFVVLLALSIALLWARLQNWAKPGVLGVFAVVLILFDLMTTGSNLEVGKKDPTVNFQHPGVINFLQQDKSLYRIDTVTDVWDVWQPDTSVMYGVFDIMGIYNPMLLNDLDRYWAELGGRSNSRYDLLNAKYLIGHKGVPLDRKKFELVYDEDPKVSVFRNNNVLPRAFVVYGADIVENNDAALQAIHDPNFDPKRRVVLSEGKSSSSGLDPSEAVVDKYSLNELVVKASAAAPGYLVLSEVYYDGWQAWVDGQPEKVLRANYLFRAVPLPSGEHEIRLVFNPPSFRYGAILSGITWLALIVWGAIGLVRRRGLGRPSS